MLLYFISDVIRARKRINFLKDSIKYYKTIIEDFHEIIK